MRTRGPLQERGPREDEAAGADRQTASLAGLAAALAVVVLAVALERELHAKVAVEECLLAGHLNCEDRVANARP